MIKYLRFVNLKVNLILSLALNFHLLYILYIKFDYEEYIIE